MTELPRITDILTPQGRPRVNTPFTKGGRQYAVVGLTRGEDWTFTLRRLDPKDGEDVLIDVSEKIFFAGVRK
jgi:hypothetical protein